MSVSYPLPGTKFHAAVEDQLGLKQHWVDSGDLDMMYDGPYGTAFYRQLHVVLHKEFRSRKTRRQLERGSKVSLRRLLALPHQAATLPFARWKLRQLARQPHRGIQPLAPALDPDAAARPTPQG
jgi:anaerobic magnesium-protoporphyrin IX monomethyl ester cyclase